MADVLALLESLAIQYPGADKTTHSQLVLVGNDATDTWTFVRGDASPDELSEAILAALSQAEQRAGIRTDATRRCSPGPSGTGAWLTGAVLGG